MVLVIACSQQHGKMAEISGQFNDGSGIKLLLEEMDTRAFRPIDSVTLDNTGKFSFMAQIDESGFWILKAPSGKILVIRLDPGDHFTLTGSAAGFPKNIQLNGNEEAVLLNNFFLHTHQNEQKVDSLEMLLAERQDSSDYYQYTQQLDTVFKQIWDDQRKTEIDFIHKNQGTLSTLVVLNYGFGLSPVLSIHDDFNFYRQVDSALMLRLPENKHVKFHHQRVEEQSKNKKKEL